MSMSEIKTCLLTLMDLTETEQSTNNYEIVESMIDNVVDGRLRLIYDNGRVFFNITKMGIDYVENMGQDCSEKATEDG